MNEEPMINFEQIKTEEAMLKIGRGNDDKNLYFYDGADLMDYERYEISAKRLSKYKWFVKTDQKCPIS